MRLTETIEDARFLAAAVAATMAELQRNERLYERLANVYERLESECAAAHRRVRELEAAGWWERLWMRVKVTV